MLCARFIPCIPQPIAAGSLLGPPGVLTVTPPDRCFTKNHLKRALPQPTPATSVGTIPKALVSPYVTFAFARLTRTPPPPDPSRARQQAVPENPDSQTQSTPIADAISTAASAFTWTLSNAPTQPRRRSKFRRFDFSTFPPKPPKTRTAPTHARHESCKRKNSAVSPYVTFEIEPFAAPGPFKTRARGWICRPAMPHFKPLVRATAACRGCSLNRKSS